MLFQHYSLNILGTLACFLVTCKANKSFENEKGDLVFKPFKDVDSARLKLTEIGDSYHETKLLDSTREMHHWVRRNLTRDVNQFEKPLAGRAVINENSSATYGVPNGKLRYWQIEYRQVENHMVLILSEEIRNPKFIGTIVEETSTKGFSIFWYQRKRYDADKGAFFKWIPESNFGLYSTQFMGTLSVASKPVSYARPQRIEWPTSESDLQWRKWAWDQKNRQRQRVVPNGHRTPASRGNTPFSASRPIKHQLNRNAAVFHPRERNHLLPSRNTTSLPQELSRNSPSTETGAAWHPQQPQYKLQERKFLNHKLRPAGAPAASSDSVPGAA